MEIIEIHDDEIDIEKIMLEIDQTIEKKEKTGLYSNEIKVLISENHESYEGDYDFINPRQEMKYFLQKANFGWDISSSYVIKSKKPIIGPILVFLKRLIRLINKTYFEVILQQQREFNRSILRTLNSIAQIDEKKSKDEHVWSDNNYYNFEKIHRGNDEYIKEYQKIYLPFFQEGINVIDVGCGRGNFLENLREAGIKAKGVDSNENMVAHCQHLGLNVKRIDALRYLESKSDKSVDGIFASHFIEHLSPSDVVKFVRLASVKLEIGKYLIIETINPLCLSVLSGAYIIDPTHTRLVHPETIKFLLESEQFINIEIKSLAPVSEQVKLKKLEGFKDDELAMLMNENFEKLNKLLYSYQDYAIIAQKGSH